MYGVYYNYNVQHIIVYEQHSLLLNRVYSKIYYMHGIVQFVLCVLTFAVSYIYYTLARIVGIIQTFLRDFFSVTFRIIYFGLLLLTIQSVSLKKSSIKTNYNFYFKNDFKYKSQICFINVMFYVLTWVIFYMTNHNCRKFKQNQIIFYICT